MMLIERRRNARESVIDQRLECCKNNAVYIVGEVVITSIGLRILNYSFVEEKGVEGPGTTLKDGRLQIVRV